VFRAVADSDFGAQIMLKFGTLRFAALCFFAVALMFTAFDKVDAQVVKGGRGFDLTLAATATGPELNAQSDLWVLETTFKPMRMIWVDVVDAKTKVKERKLIWYLVYKAVSRPLPRRNAASDVAPVNKFDAVPTPLFVPEFTLVTNDNNRQNIYPDVILPEAQAAIARRERLVVKNSVEIVSEIPPVTSFDAKAEKAVYGVVMWERVKSTTDFFTVFMTGFSSGYKMGEGPNGEPLTLRRTIIQEFWRPGDRFEQGEQEIRRRGKPRWIYRTDDVTEKPADEEG